MLAFRHVDLKECCFAGKAFPDLEDGDARTGKRALSSHSKRGELLGDNAPHLQTVKSDRHRCPGVFVVESTGSVMHISLAHASNLAAHEKLVRWLSAGGV
jgi:hypothetical protein